MRDPITLAGWAIGLGLAALVILVVPPGARRVVTGVVLTAAIVGIWISVVSAVPTIPDPLQGSQPEGDDDASDQGHDNDRDSSARARHSHREQKESPPTPNPEIIAALKALGIEGTRVPWSVVQDRYRELVKQYHPDRYSNLGLPPEMIETAEQRFSEVAEAYKTLQRYRRPL